MGPLTIELTNADGAGGIAEIMRDDRDDDERGLGALEVSCATCSSLEEKL
jgi:hypothetical protein